jgi:hypothetical protein
MKRLLVIGLLVLPLLVLASRTRQVSRYEARPLPPRPEVAPPEPAADFRLRFAWGDDRRAVVRVASASAAAADDAEWEADEDEDEAKRPAPRPSTGTRARLMSDWMSSEERARRDLEKRLREQLSRWLVDSGVEPGWSPPDRLVGPLLPPAELEEQDRDYARLYRASAALELTAEQRGRLVREYDRQVAEKRLGLLGGVLGFVLACLGVTTAYVRADEASRGYYTNRLRLVAAAAVGAAGVVLVQWLRRG